MEKMTFRQKVENFWYHNKYTVIVVSAFAIFIIISTFQLLTKKEPDANLLYLGPASISFSAEDILQGSMAEIMKEDYNGDGKKRIDYIELTTVKADDSFDTGEGNFKTGYTPTDLKKTVGESFAAQIIAGDSMIYLLDEEYFGAAEDTGVLMPLSEALGYTPEFAYNDYALYLSDLDISYMPAFELFPKSTLICIRYPVTLTNGKKEVELREKSNISVFRDMVSHVYEDKPVLPEKKEPESIGLEDFKEALKPYAQRKGLKLSEEELIEMREISPEGFFEAVGANLFKAGGRSYLHYLGEIYVLGKHVGGDGLLDVEICDFDDDDVFDLIFTYSYKKNDTLLSSASVFNFATLKETFLQFEHEGVLALKKLGDEHFEVYSSAVSSPLTNALLEKNYQKHLYTLVSKAKDIVIILKDV